MSAAPASEPPGGSPRRAARFVSLVAIALAAGFALGLGALMFGELGSGSLWNSDDALYAQLVRDMVDTGSVSPAPWFDYALGVSYPIGVRYMAVVASIAGVTPFGLRLGATLAALGCIATLCMTGRGDRRGAFAVLLLGLQPIFYLLSQRVMHDALLAFFMTGAIVAHAEASARKASAPWHALAFAAATLASLTKIYAGLLPVAVIFLDVVVSDRPRLRRAGFLIPLVAAAAIPTLWFLADGTLHGVVSDLVARFGGKFEGVGASAAPASVPEQSGILRYVIEQGGAGVALALLAAGGAVVAGLRRDPLDRLTLTWALVATTVLGLMKTSLVAYALVALVPYALLAGTALAGFVARMPILALPILLLALLGLPSLVPTAALAHSADDRVAALATLQAGTPPTTLLCTVDVYHASPTYYARRKVAYLTEDARSLRILRRTFGEVTVPTLGPGDIRRRLDAAGAFACIMSPSTARSLMETLRGPLGMITPDPSLLGPDVVLLTRGVEFGAAAR